MTLEDDALHALKNAGEAVKTGLWQASDMAFLEDAATQLAQLQASAAGTNDADLRDQYRDAATLLKNRIAAEMCRRANDTGEQVAQDVCLGALELAMQAVPGLSLLRPLLTGV